MSLAFSLGLILLYGAICALSEGDSKRLLLNDPDVLNDRMNRLENMVHMLNTTLKQVIAENKQQQQTIEQQRQEIQQQKQDIQNQYGSGATYIRWGRKTCPTNGTEIVYSGFAGGGSFNDYGSAPESVCLPPDPDFGKTGGSDHGRMYGAEFYGNFFASGAHAEDVPCSLCRATRASTAIMIPGKNRCYDGWKMEYHGYLSSGCFCDKSATSFVCVDNQPEFIIGGQRQEMGRLFESVRAKCGSLKCPPYEQDRPLTCVVCSK